MTCAALAEARREFAVATAAWRDAQTTWTIPEVEVKRRWKALSVAKAALRRVIAASVTATVATS